MRLNALIWGALGLAGGVVLRSFFIVPFVTLCVVAACIALLVFVYVLRTPSSRTALAVTVGCVVAFLCGVWRMDQVIAQYDVRVHALLSTVGERVTVVGVVSRDVAYTEEGRVVVVRTHTIDQVAHDVRIRIATDVGAPIAYGDVIEVTGALHIPASFETEYGRAFRYNGYLRAQDILFTLSYADVRGIERLESLTLTQTVLRTLYDGKARMREGIEAVLPEPHAGFGEGLLLGEKHALGKSLEDTFRTVGVVHIIVLSGYNLTIIAESVMRLLSRVLYPRTRAVVGGVSIVLFAVMVGLSATVARAAIMALLVLVARAYGKSYHAVIGLAIAGSAMVLVHPYVLVYDPGFQLSFLATLGLVLVAPIIETLFRFAPTRFQIREYLTSTCATQIFVTPFLVYSMGAVSLISLVANVLILPVVPFAMFLTFVSGLAGMVAHDTLLFVGYPAYVALSYVLVIAERLAGIPYALVSLPPFSFWYVIGAYVFISGGIWYGTVRSKRKMTEIPAA